MECEEHHEIPISRTGTNALEPVHLLLLCLSVAMMFLGVLTGKFLFFGLLIPLVVAIWWVTHLLAGTLHDWRRREGSHCIMSFTTRQEPVADHMLEVMDTSSISQAVIVFKIPREVVFGFGNEKYAAAFKQLNSAVPYTGDLPSAAWF
ncbi:MAG TPA: hypothetical protein VHU83_09665 [Bryobacteraceae bacterium]|nr:hypothetical protein [Bryobacteraceae bacterium]